MKKDTVNQSVYIHMDSEINNVVTSGIDFCDFMNGVGLPPEHILLLKHRFSDVSFNAHTAFDFVETVTLSKLKNQSVHKFDHFCWVDFEEIDLVNQLSPQEIAELLYLAHTGRHLRSPFYYKLQNNFIYLTKEDGWYNKVYYRNMNHFYELLSYVIAKKTTEMLQEKALFGFTKKRRIVSPPVPVLKRLSGYFKEGACVAFLDAEKTRTALKIPIGIDLLEEMHELERSSEPIAYRTIPAVLHYDLKQNEWNLVES
ncbi:hypothetical protein [Listeria costaricensis]|uniref:hypothetical protein n=1 Tax=Listeria costaricensis TaxID=2026604 RepID=UPI000C079249|nr:hypothetical protein [Listeria costaricensis]